MGIDENYLDVYEYQVSAGRPFTENDYSQRRKIALLDEKAAVTLFAGENPVGKTIEIKGEPFQVAGIVVSSNASTKVINSYSDYHMYAGGNSNGIVLIPNTTWIRNIPTLLFFKNGQLIDKFVGAANKAKLKEKFEANL